MHVLGVSNGERPTLSPEQARVITEIRRLYWLGYPMDRDQIKERAPSVLKEAEACYSSWKAACRASEIGEAPPVAIPRPSEPPAELPANTLEEIEPGTFRVELAGIVKQFGNRKRRRRRADTSTTAQTDEADTESLDLPGEKCPICGWRRKWLGDHLRSDHGLNPRVWINQGFENIAFEIRPTNRSLPVAHWSSDWTRDYVAERIQAYRQRDLSLDFGFVRKHEPELVHMAVMFFGSWRDAIAEPLSFLPALATDAATARGTAA